MIRLNRKQTKDIEVDISSENFFEILKALNIIQEEDNPSSISCSVLDSTVSTGEHLTLSKDRRYVLRFEYSITSPVEDLQATLNNASESTE